MRPFKLARTKIDNLRDLLQAAQTPVPLMLDSLRLQGTNYVARLKNGLAFDLQPRCGDWFTLLECAIRMDYFQNGIEVREGDTVVDIGANFGAFTIAASRKVGKRGRVYSFEPNPAMFERLQQNLKRNECENVTAFNAAVGGIDGEATLYVSHKSAFSSVQSEVAGRNWDVKQAVTVPMRAINSVLTEVASRVDLLKIDCEGAEYDMLDSLAPVQAAAIRQIAMEVHHIPGKSIDSLTQRLQALGFDVHPTAPLTAFSRARRSHDDARLAS